MGFCAKNLKKNRHRISKYDCTINVIVNGSGVMVIVGGKWIKQSEIKFWIRLTGFHIFDKVMDPVIFPMVK